MIKQLNNYQYTNNTNKPTIQNNIKKYNKPKT